MTLHPVEMIFNNNGKFIKFLRFIQLKTYVLGNSKGEIGTEDFFQCQWCP